MTFPYVFPFTFGTPRVFVAATNATLGDNVGPARDFLSDDNGDLAIVNGDFALVRGAAAARQGIKIRVRMFLGEYFLDDSIGVPWFQSILIKNPNPLVVRELITQAIASTPDVTQVLAADMEIDSATRQGSISYTVRTVYTTAPISGEIAFS